MSTTFADNTTRVIKILGREYPLRCAEDQERLSQVADYVDKRMRQISEAFSLSSHSDIAVLAALNIANELFDARGDVAFKASDFEERAQSILMKLEERVPELENVATSD